MFRLSLLAFTLLICASAKAANIEFWHSMTGAKGRLLGELVEEFNRLPAQQGHTTVKLQFAGSYEDGINKLRTALIAHRGPHLMQITDIGAKLMVDSGAVAPLQDFIDHDPDFPDRQIVPSIRRYYEAGGRLQALPFASSNPVLYYNKAAFTKAGLSRPPATLSELFDDARKLTDKANKQFGITWPLHSWFFEEFLAVQNAVLVEPGNGRDQPATRANYVSPEGLAVASAWQKMVDEGVFANYGRGWDPAEQNFLAGRVAMLITSTSDVFEIQRQVSFPLGTGRLPLVDPNKKGGTIIGGNALWLFKDKPANEVREAYEFLKFMASASVQEKWHQRTGYFPIRQDVIDKLKADGFYDRNPAAWTAIEQLQESPVTNATRGAFISVFPEAREQIAAAIEEILSHRSNVLDALTKAQEKTNVSIQRSARVSAAP